MRRNNIDDLFNSGLKNQHFGIKNVYLEDLNKRLKKKKKKLFFFRFFSLLGGAILLFGTYYTFFNTEKTAAPSTVANNSPVPAVPKKIIPSKANSAQNDNMVEEQKKNVTSKKKNTFKYGSFLEGQDLKGKKLGIKKMPLILDEASTAGRADRNFTELNNVHSSNKKITPLEPSTEEKEHVLDKNNTWAQEESDHLSLDKETIYNSVKNDSTKPTLIAAQTSKKDSVPNRTVDLASKPSRNTANLFLSLEAGMNFNSAKYQGTEANYYRTGNQENVTANYEFNANVLLKNKFFFGVGAGFNTQNYDYNYNTSTVSYDTTLVVDSTYIFDYYIYQQGVIVDSVYYYTYNTTENVDSTLSNSSFQGVTQAKYITIPLNVGYSFTHKKFMLGLFVTTRINILQNARGGVYSNNEFKLFDSPSNSLFKKSYLSFSFKADVAYNVYKNMYLHSSFSYSPYLNPVAEIPTMQRRLQVFNIGLGVTYKFVSKK